MKKYFSFLKPRFLSTLTDKNFKKWSNNKCTSPIGTLIVTSPFEKKNLDIWKPMIKSLLTNGHEVGLVNLFDEKDTTLNRRLYLLEQARNSIGPQTVLISSSIAGFYTQKFLESFSAKGCFFINSFPPNPTNLIKKSFTEISGKPVNTLTSEVLYKEFKYSGIFRGMFANFDSPFCFTPEMLFGDSNSSLLMRNIYSPGLSVILEMLNDPITLENKVVPMFFVNSSDDKIVTKEERNNLIDFHGFSDTEEEDTLQLDSSSHLFWFNRPDLLMKTTKELVNFLETV